MAILGLNPFATEPRDGRGLLSLGTCAPVKNRRPPKSSVRGWAVYSHDQLALGLKSRILHIDEIKTVQAVLHDLGFYSGPVNGMFDTALQLAHAAYRKSFLQWVATGPVTTFAEEMTCLAEAEARAGVREEGGDNRGKKVEEYQRVVGSHVVGQSWCAAFACWCMERAARMQKDFLFELPRQGMAFRFEDWAVDQRACGVYLLDPARISVRRGDIVVFNFSHIGICLEDAAKGAFRSVEGNTTDRSASLEQERDGGGVFVRARSMKLVRRIVRLGVPLTAAAIDPRNADAAGWGAAGALPKPQPEPAAPAAGSSAPRTKPSPSPAAEPTPSTNSAGPTASTRIVPRPTAAEQTLAAQSNAEPDDGLNAARFAAREKVVRDFYERGAGLGQDRADIELGVDLRTGKPNANTKGYGIDLGAPVEVVELPPPEVIYQYVRIGRGPGNFFDPLGGQSGDALGLNTDTAIRSVGSFSVPLTEPKRSGLLTRNGPVVDDWTDSANPVPTRGGGRQLTVDDTFKAILAARPC